MISILVPIVPGLDFESQLEAALNVARRVRGHIEAVCLRFGHRRVPGILAAIDFSHLLAQRYRAARTIGRITSPLGIRDLSNEKRADRRTS